MGSHQIKSLQIKGIGAYHDGNRGTERGQNTIFCFQIDGLRLCHLGDLGHVPNEQEAQQIRPVDLLLMPVGRVYTIDLGRLARLLKS